jgi:tetraacyldisaccharide 4'-kinase
MTLRDWLLTAWFAPRQLRHRWKLLWHLALLVAWPLSLITRAVSAYRRRQVVRSARVHGRPSGPVVIVVGNLVVGGAGKTPIVMALLDLLRSAGLSAGVIARGYKSDARQHSSENSDISAPAGDEARLIQRRCAVPVYTHVDRHYALQAITSAHPQLQVVVSDDGLQHSGLPRDIEIVVIDPRGLGNGQLLPAGPLRESTQRLLQVDAIVFSKGARSKPLGLNSLNPSLHFFSDIEPIGFRQLTNQDSVISVAEFCSIAGSARLAACAGIASPASFFSSLQNLLAPYSLALADTACLALDDHADIQEALLAQHLAAHSASMLLMTEKDMVKCDQRWACAPACWALVIRATLPPDLIRCILDKTHHLLGLQGHGPTST